MERIKVLRSVIVFLALLLAVGIGSRLWSGPTVVTAGSLVQYKVVSTGAANTVYEYEKVLNDMAFQGWEFDHAVVTREWAVFKK